MNLIGQNTHYTFTKFIQDHTAATIFASIGLIMLILLPIILFLHKIFPKKQKTKELNIFENHKNKEEYFNHEDFDEDLDDENWDGEDWDDEDSDDDDSDDDDYYDDLKNFDKLNVFRKLNILLREFKELVYFTISFILILLTPLIINTIDASSNNFTYENSTSITEVKDYIKIDNDKLTINPLPDKYYYENKNLKTNEHHDFKIIKDDFYTDETLNVKLIDVTGQEYYISKSEFEQLK